LLLERALRSLPLADLGNVLIVGAGHDPYRHLFAGAASYTCLDIEPLPGITDVVADATCMPLAGGAFDCVLATECLEHVADPFRFVSEITRVTRPGGQIVLTVPFLFHQHGDPHDYWRPTRQCLASLFGGCRAVRIWTLGNRLHVLSDLLTTADGVGRCLLPLRAWNHVLARLPGSITTAAHGSSAPTGFLVTAIV
jgi:SAM-dependent methyltransferase